MLSRVQINLFKWVRSFSYFLVSFSSLIIFSLFFKIRIEGKDNLPANEKVIIAANHQNFFDGFFLSYILGSNKKVSFVIAKDQLKIKLSMEF